MSIVINHLATPVLQIRSSFDPRPGRTGWTVPYYFTGDQGSEEGEFGEEGSGGMEWGGWVVGEDGGVEFDDAG